MQWAAALGGDISATPAVVDGVAYVPDWGGYLSAVDTTTGNVIWQKSVSTLAAAAGPMIVDSAAKCRTRHRSGRVAYEPGRVRQRGRYRHPGDDVGGARGWEPEHS